MRSPAGALRTVALLVAASLVVGCGVRPQDAPETVSPAAAPSPTPPGDTATTGPQLTVFLVRGADLVPVQRRTDAATVQAALEQLVEGPSRAEAGTGIRTALPPEVVGVEEVGVGGIVTVAVTRGFTGITGGNQLLAVAQVVWTLSDLPTISGVRFVVDGTPVEVPTDVGLSDRPVNRDDYRTVAPVEPASSTPPPGEAGAPSGTPTPPR
ncbi:GerMN domain-containing protein [Geodermatophilus sp. SYSU D00710]